VRLKASTKPPLYNLIHEFFINMASTMACPNFKKGLKMAFGPLGVIRTFSYLDGIPNAYINPLLLIFIN
jgi:hypothetical protein